jgi:hypothetical protein
MAVRVLARLIELRGIFDYHALYVTDRAVGPVSPGDAGACW